MTVANLTAQGQFINARVLANANNTFMNNISGFNNITNISYEHAMWFYLGQDQMTTSDQEVYDDFLVSLPLILSIWDSEVHSSIYMAVWDSSIQTNDAPGLFISYPLSAEYSTYWHFTDCVTVPANEYNYTCRPWWTQMIAESINLEDYK